jgi:hypothetical protein
VSNSNKEEGKEKTKGERKIPFFSRLQLEKGIAASVLEQCPRKIAGKRKGR